MTRCFWALVEGNCKMCPTPTIEGDDAGDSCQWESYTTHGNGD